MISAVNVSVRVDGTTVHRLVTVEMDDKAKVVSVFGFDPDTRIYGEVGRYTDVVFQVRRANQDASYRLPTGELLEIEHGSGCGCRG